ncbi:MAG: glycosyltransferase family 4 protein, partial [Acidobacteriota bacterium]|nr:glycosyltransferase family 4 protein [Acidobacteriota bacterium]
MKVCFFARLRDPHLLRKMSFYADDIRILEELGHEVFPVTDISKIPFRCDLYFVWWYGWGALPLLLAKVLNRPKVVAGALHYEEPRYGYFGRPFYHRWMTRWSVRNADAVLAISRIELEGVKKIGARHPVLAYLCASNAAPVAAWSGRENLVFSIGHMYQRASIDRKGFDNVVRAIPLVAQTIPDVRFVMAGTVGGEFYLDRLAESLNVSGRVTFPGQIDNEARSKYLSQARVLAQPAEFEGFGLAQLEAMIHGLPVVTSPAG